MRHATSTAEARDAAERLRLLAQMRSGQADGVVDEDLEVHSWSRPRDAAARPACAAQARLDGTLGGRPTGTLGGTLPRR